MSQNYTFKKDIWGSRIDLHSGDKLLGTVRDKSLSSKVLAETDNLKLEYRPKGILEQEYFIINQEDQKTIGKVHFHIWKSKGTIEWNNKLYSWKINNAWNTKWSISEENTEILKFNSSKRKGVIESEADDVVLLLTGLFLQNRLEQTWAIVLMIAIFLPTFITIL